MQEEDEKEGSDGSSGTDGTGAPLEPLSEAGTKAALAPAEVPKLELKKTPPPSTQNPVTSRIHDLKQKYSSGTPGKKEEEKAKKPANSRRSNCG